MPAQAMRVNVLSDSYGHWWVTPTFEGAVVGSRVSDGPFQLRQDAIHYAVKEYPDARIMCDGVTVGASIPPPLPVVDRQAERASAGLRPEVRVPGPAPMATAPRGITQTETPAPIEQPLPTGEPMGYGQGARFEREHGKRAGELGGGVLPSAPAIEVQDPLIAKQAAAQAMREQIEKIKAGA